MAEFLTTTGISNSLEKIVHDAEDRLFLVSPYLQINRRLREFIEDKTRDRIDIRLVYREINPNQTQESKWLGSMLSIRTFQRKNLHAKCYLNEKEALLTSMNLYQYSQVHNDEMGILVSATDDRDLYDKIYRDVMRIIRGSEELPKIGTTVRSKESVAAEATPRAPRQSRESRLSRERRVTA